MSCASATYQKLINDLKLNLLKSVQIKINHDLDPLINQINADSTHLEELETINSIIKLFPVFKQLENEYNVILKENSELKKQLINFNSNKLELVINDLKNPSIAAPIENNFPGAQNTIKNVKINNTSQVQENDEIFSVSDDTLTTASDSEDDTVWPSIASDNDGNSMEEKKKEEAEEEVEEEEVEEEEVEEEEVEEEEEEEVEEEEEAEEEVEEEEVEEEEEEEVEEEEVEEEEEEEVEEEEEE